MCKHLDGVNIEKHLNTKQWKDREDIQTHVIDREKYLNIKL